MTRFVPGEGPQPCRYMLVGEGPGVEEDKWGRPWVGKAGRELWRYLWRSCGLGWDDVYATNLVKFRVPDDGDPTPEDIARDAPLLREEVANVHPEVIVTLGRWSSRHFLGELDMDWCHGIPQMVGSIVVMPIVHPAAGLHSTEFQGTIAWDFEQLGRLLRGEIEPRALEDEYPAPDYFELPAFTGYKGRTSTLAVDTEGSAAKPWCYSLTGTPGIGMACRKGPGKLGHIILHNAMHDLGVLRALGVEYDRFDDTMIMAYLLCVEPQGLKALARRHCGMEMSSYEDITSEASHKIAMEWLEKAAKWSTERVTGGSKTTTASGRSTRRSTRSTGRGIGRRKGARR